MIYTLTMNPSVDYVMKTEEIKFGETNRSLSEELFFGGKAINVSAILANLGIKSTALGFIAGFTGEALEKGLQEQGIKTDFIKLPAGFTRINIKLKGASETEINAQGPKIEEQDLLKLYEKLEKLEEGDTLVLAGSVPGCLPADIYERIMLRLADRRVRFIVDATGKLLTNVLKYKPYLIKPNKSELEEISGRQLDSDDAIALAAKELQQCGAMNVLVSLGKDGALLLDEFGKIHRRPAFDIQAQNTVGAGDSMVAGFIAGAEKGYEYALLLGSAAGSATAASKGLASGEAILNLLENR